MADEKKQDAPAKPTHTVRKTFHAAEENMGVVKPGQPFTPATEIRAKMLAKRGLIEEGYTPPKTKPEGGNKATQPGGTKPAPQQGNKGSNPPPPPPPAPPAPQQ